MVNVNILNNLIKGISEQIPLVNSFYTKSPYDVWNTKEIKYGSVSFVITNINTRDTTTVYDATIYYADRLLEDNSNIDSVHSDAATVIQTIVGALNTADEYLEVSYPVGITLFEQDFEDVLGGGYSRISISTDGMGECFEDELSVPTIIATSAYYTKDEIKELFPLKTSLSSIAFSGSYNDLKDKPDIVSQQQYNDLKNEINNVKSDVKEAPSKQDFNNLTQAVIDSTSSLAGELDQKVNIDYFDKWADGIEADLESKPTKQSFDNLKQDLTSQINTINKNVDNKVSSSYFESWKKITESTLNQKASSQALNDLSNQLNNVNNSLQQQIDDKVSEDELKAIIGDIGNLDGLVTKQDFDNLTEAVAQSSASLASELDKKVNVLYFDGWADGIERMLDNKVSKQTFDNTLSNVYKKAETYSKSEIDKKLDNVVIDGEINLSGYYTKDEIDDIISNIDTSDIDLSDYAKKSEVYTKSQTYSKSEIDYRISNVKVDLSDYAKNSEVYTKSEIDDIVDNIEGGGTTDLSNYYTKSQTYSKSEIDTIVGDINNILNNILYIK